MHPFRIAVIAAFLLAAQQIFAAAPVVTVTASGVSAKVTPGAKTAWIGWVFTTTTSVANTHMVEDTDGDGVVTLPPRSTIRSALFAAIDMATGEIGYGQFATPATHRPLPSGTVVRGTSGAYTNVLVAEESALLWIRPGAGAWTAPYWSASYRTAGTQVYTIAQMAPLATGGAPAPAGFARGDVLLTLAARATDIYGAVVDADLAGNLAGRISFDFQNGASSIQEGTDFVGKLFRSGGADGTASVRVTASDVTAKAGVDFHPLDVVVTFAPGELVGSYTLRPIDDDVYGVLSELTLRISDPAGATLDPDVPTTRKQSIIDNDPAPLLSFGSVPASVQETNADWTLNVPLVLTGKTRVPAEFRYSVTSPPSAPANVNVTVPVGQTPAAIPVLIRGNTVSNPDVTYTVELTALKHVRVNAPMSLQVKAIDDDLPRLVMDDASGTEARFGSVRVRIEMHGSADPGTNYSWTTVDGTAIAGVDYEATSGANDSGAFIRLFDDALAEGPETFYVELRDLRSVEASKTRITLTIVDDEAGLPVVSVGNATVTEGASGTTTTGRVPVRVSSASAVPIEAMFSVLPGTAKGSDYGSSESRSIIIPAGSLLEYLDIAVHGDDVDEPDETVIIQLGYVTNASLGDKNATLTIVDDDQGTTPYLSVFDARVMEGTGANTPAPFRIELSVPQASPVSVDYVTSDGTANVSSDYTLTFGKVTFAPGEITKTVNVPVHGDGVSEPTENFHVTIHGATGATLARQVAEGVILDDDVSGWPVVSIGDIRVIEGHDGKTAATFTLTLAQASPQQVSVSVATVPVSAVAGVDYESQSQLVTFAPGQVSRTVTVQILADRVREADETFELRLTFPDGIELIDDRAVCTIVDDDVPPGQLTVGDLRVNEGDGGWWVAKLAVTLSSIQVLDVRVDYATSALTAESGFDYQQTSGTLVFTPGETTKFIDLRVWGDTTKENDETFRVTLANASVATIGRASTDVVIADDDTDVVAPPPTPPAPKLPTVTINDMKVKEGDSGWKAVGFTLTLSEALAQPVQIDTVTFAVSATMNVDFEANVSSITIPAGQTTATVIVRVAGDTLHENHETFEVRIASAPGLQIADDRGVCTIEDDDAQGRRRSVRH